MDLKIYENRECEYKIRRNKNKLKKELVSMEIKYKQREKDEIIVLTFLVRDNRRDFIILVVGGIESSDCEQK